MRKILKGLHVRVVPLAATLTVLATGAIGFADGKFRYCTILNGMQEVPPNASTAIGCGVFEIDTCANTVNYRIVFTPTALVGAETAAHFHGPADPGVNAGVIVGLPAGNPKVGVWNYAEAQEADILGGRIYVNIHSGGFPGGEIRGQVVSHVADIDAAQEVPPTGTAGRGFGLFTIDTRANTLRYYIAYTGLSSAETAAHIHGYSAHGANSAVVHQLPAGSPKVGVWNYLESVEKNILRGLTYVNIHTAAFPAGEIRGQVTPLVVPIDALQEVPPNGSVGAACGLLSIDEGANILGYDYRSGSLSTPETAAHIHGYAAAGVNAGVLHGLPAGARKLGTWAYPAGDEGLILDGLTYTNIHTTAFPGGEIRGQQRFPSLPCFADINGDRVVDLNDLSIQLVNFGLPGDLCDGDLNGDSVVDLTDLSELLVVFGLACPT